MDAVGGTLLFAGKWLFIGLVYLVLLVVVITVRRELQAQLAGQAQAPTLSAAGRLRVIRAGSDPRLQVGTVLVLDNETTLGADKGNDISLTDPYISGRHAQLRWDGVEWWLEDLGSRNGTFVNGRPCPPNRPQAVPVGAVIMLGDLQFELVE